jgi:hypothetical protein
MISADQHVTPVVILFLTRHPPTFFHEKKVKPAATMLLLLSNLAEFTLATGQLMKG